MLRVNRFHCGALWLMVLGGGLCWWNRLHFEKLLTALCMPCGLIWITLGAVAINTYRSGDRKLAGLLGVVWILFSLVGNSIISSGLAAVLERPYLHVRIAAQENYDLVVLLGGGTMFGPHGDAQLTGAGDRVMLAARMLSTGKTDRVLCTGDAIPGISATDSPGPAEETRQILVDLGIHADRIDLARGHNTSEEIGQIAAYLQQSKPGQRIGLITSAWHMRRAMRLAERAGLRMEPLPADFLTTKVSFSPCHLVPNAQGFRTNQLVLKEFLAVLVGR